MKENQPNDFLEISATKQRMNILKNNQLIKDIAKNPALIKDPETNNIFNNKVQYFQNKRSINNIENNYENKESNTNITNDNNVPPAPPTLLQKMVNVADNLIIDVINSTSLDKNLKIEINPLGMIQGSKRNANDGITYFGLIEDDDPENNNENSKVDFIINSNELINNEINNIIGRHFRIRFDINTSKYYIKDLGCGFGTFKKIVKKAKIKDTYLINIGNSYIVCTFGVDEYYPEDKSTNVENGDNTLNIKVFSDIPQTEPYFFNPKQFRRIYIGRDISCNIIVDDSLLSRVHCTMEYDEEEGWIIYDGKIDDDESKNKPSTNGTWLFLIEETPIEDGLIFKNNKNAFECHIVKSIENE